MSSSPEDPNAQPRGFFARIYQPKYVYRTDPKTKEKVLQPRYCNGRFTKGQSICIHICLFIVLLLLILVPILYFVVIPNFLQYKIDRIGLNGDTIRIHKAFVGEITNDTINMSADFRIDGIVPLPVHGGFGANTIRILGDGKEIMSLNAPEQQFWLNQEIALQMDNTLTMNAEQQKNLHEIVRKFSSPEGLKNFVLRLEMNPPITSHGFTVYRSLPLHRDIPLGDLIGSAKGLLESPKSDHKSPLIFKGPDPSKSGQALRSKFSAEEIMKLPESLGGFELLWKSFEVSMRDEGLKTGLGAAFENPKYVALKKLASIDYFLAIEGVRAMKMSLFNLELKPELNDDMNIGFDFSFVDPMIDTKLVQAAIEKASKSYADTGDFGFALMGPVTISNADFVKEVTKDLKVSGSLSDILTLAPKTVFRFVSSDGTATTDAIQDIIGNSKIALNVLGDKISAELGMNIPLFDFLKPPKQISFPYQAGISLYAGDAKVIQTDVSPVTVGRESRGLMINTGITVVPENSESAADGLARAINPILSANPTSSSIGIKDLYFSPPNGQPFKWCKDLFGERILNITLPAIDKVALVDTIANPATSNAASKVSALIDGPINLAQLTDRPGFGATGNVQIKYNETLPEVKVDLGFFNIDTTVESVKLASLEMPSGLKFFPSNGGTAINAALVLNRDNQLEGKIQKLADAVLNNSETPSYFGVTNLRLGTSGSNQLITFSKIVVDLDTESIKKLLNNQPTSSGNIPLKKGMVKLDSLDLTINSATDLSASVSSRIENPISQLTVSVGSISLNTILDGKDLMGVSVSPIRLATGANTLPLTVGLKPVRGGNGLEQTVATFANAVLEKNQNVNLQVAVTGLTLTPPGVSSGPAVIDQFRNVRIGMSASNIVKSLGSGSESSGIVDISALLPSDDFVDRLAPSVKFLQMDVQANQRIASGLDVDYNNPLPVSVQVPYLSVNALVDGSQALDLEIAGVTLARQAGSMKPRMNLVFKRDVADKIAKLTSNFLEGKKDSKIAITGVQFGGSAQDKNTLISGVSIDVSSVIEQGPSFASRLQKAGASLRGLEKRQAPQDPLLNIEGPNGSSLTLNSVDLELTPSKLINAKVGGALKSSVALDINIPYFAISTGLGETKAMDLNMGVSARGNNPSVQLNTGIQIHDSEELAQKVSRLVDALLEKKELGGNLKLSGVAVGASREDVIDALTKIEVGLPLNKIVKPSSGSLPLGNPGKLIQDIAVQLGNVVAQTKQGRTVSLNAGLQFNSPFQVSLKGFNYFTVTAGLDESTIVQVASTSGITVAPGTNNINAGLDLTFPSSSGAQDTVARFVQDLKNNPGNTPQKFVVSNIAFGPNQENSIRVLSKVVAKINSGSVITKDAIDKTMDIIKKKLGETDASGSLAKAFIKKFVLQTPQDGRIYATIVGGVQDASIDASIDVGYANFQAIFDQQKLLEFSLLDSFTVKKNGNNLVANVSNALDIVNDDNLNKNIARMFGNLVENRNITNQAGITGVVFGATRDPEEVIDTFSKVSFSLELNPLVAPIKKIINDILNAKPSPDGPFKDFKLAVTKADLDVVDEGTLSVEVGARLEGLPLELDIDLPYTFAGLKYNGKDYAANTIQGLLIKKNEISTKALLAFPDNREAAQSLVTLVGNIAFNRGEETKDEVTIYGAGFGFSKDVQTKLLSYVSLNVKLAPYVKMIKEKLASSTGKNPLKLIDGSFEKEGIVAVATLEDLGLPVKMLASVKTDVKWALKGETDPSKFLTMIQAQVPPFSLPSVKVVMNATNIDHTVQSLTESLVLATEWVPFADNARAGFLTLIGSNGAVFNRLDSAYFNGPPGVVLTDLIAVDTRYDRSVTVEPNQFGDGFAFKMKVAFPNGTPLRFNAGQLEVAAGLPIDPVTPNPDTTQLSLIASNDFIVKANGDQIDERLSNLPVHGLLDGRVYGFKSLDFDGLIGAAVGSPEYIRTIVRTKRNGEYIEWFTQLMKAMEDSLFVGKVYENKKIIGSHIAYTSDIPTTE